MPTGNKRRSIGLAGLVVSGLLLVACGIDNPQAGAKAGSGGGLAVQEQFEVAPGQEIGVMTAGEGPDALIMLHGFAATSEEWRHFGSIFPKGRGTLVALDLIGHGRSATPGWTDYSVTANASAVARFIAAKKFDHPVLAGHSLGGLVALATVWKLPRRGAGAPKALILIATPVYPIPYPRFVAVFRDRSLLGGLVDLLPSRLKAERVLRGLFFDPGKVTPAMVTAYARNLEDPQALEGIRRTARQLDLQDLEKFAATYRGLDLPILVIGGAADPVVPPEHLQRFVAEVKHATLVMVPRCGHLLLDECPVAVERAIAGFLRGLE